MTEETETLTQNPQDQNQQNKITEEGDDTVANEIDEFETRLPYPKAEGWSLNVIIMVAILGILSALLLSFIIYAAATWNKEIVNEYA